MFDKSANIPYNVQCCPDAGTLDVRPILYAPGKSISFRLSLDLSDLDFAGRKPVTRPVEIEGTVRNRADTLSLDLTASTTLDAACDRCGKRFPLPKDADFHCLLAESVVEDDNDEIILLSMSANSPGPRSFSAWTPARFVRRTARASVRVAGPISTTGLASASRKSTPAGRRCPRCWTRPTNCK